MPGKKIIVALCVVFCLLLAGCGSKDEVRPFETADVEKILGTGIFSDELEAVDMELACELYGIKPEDVAECVAYLSTGATAEELVLFIMSEESDTEQVKEACGRRVEEQIFGFKSYKPSEVPKLENAICEVRGNTVLMLVANDWEKAAKAAE